MQWTWEVALVMFLWMKDKVKYILQVLKFTSQLVFSFLLSRALKVFAYGQRLDQHLSKADNFLAAIGLHFHITSIQSLEERPWPVN